LEGEEEQTLPKAESFVDEEGKQDIKRSRKLREQRPGSLLTFDGRKGFGAKGIINWVLNEMEMAWWLEAPPLLVSMSQS
jgi:hypothetical protein